MNRSTSLTDRLSIGYYTPDWPLGACPNGIVTYVSTLSEELGAMGHQLTILAGAVDKNHHDPGVYDVAALRTRIGKSPGNRIVYGLWRRIAAHPADSHLYRRALTRTFQRALQEQRLDIFEMEESFGHVDRIRSISPIPVCLRLHGPWFLNGRALGVPEDDVFRRRVKAEGEAIRDADLVVAPSHHVLEETRAYYGLKLERAEVIPYPAPRSSQRWRLDQADPKLVLFVGRFDRHKGGDLIIDAFARLLSRVPDARLRFVGPDRGFLDSSGRAWHIEEYLRERLPGALESKQVEWMGFQPFPALSALRCQALLTVVCSRFENLPLAVLETMSLGCPLVAARTGGIPEVVEHESNGLLHQAGDSEALAAQILRLLDDPPRAAELGRQAASDCQRKLSPEIMASRMVDCYVKAIEEAPPRR
ncbi:MAG: glycosyltransferase family 4 protein [Isosphaeraceae bacterium]